MESLIPNIIRISLAGIYPQKVRNIDIMASVEREYIFPFVSCSKWIEGKYQPSQKERSTLKEERKNVSIYAQA